MSFCPCASTSNVPGSPGRNPHFSPRQLVQNLTAGAAQWGLRAGPTRGRGAPWSDPSKWGGLDSQAGEPCPGPGPTPPCVCLLPQCEQFVEQHAPQLQTLVSGGWDAHTACQVHPPFPADPGTFLSSRTPTLSGPRSSRAPFPGVRGSPRSTGPQLGHALACFTIEKAVSEKSRESHRRMKKRRTGRERAALRSVV